MVFPDHTHLLFKTKEYKTFLKIITSNPCICKMEYPKFILSIQKEESIRIQRVKSSRHVAVAAIHSYGLLVFAG